MYLFCNLLCIYFNWQTLSKFLSVTVLTLGETPEGYLYTYFDSAPMLRVSSAGFHVCICDHKLVRKFRMHSLRLYRGHLRVGRTTGRLCMIRKSF